MANNLNRLPGFSKTSPYRGVTEDELQKLKNEQEQISLKSQHSSTAKKIEFLEPSKVIEKTEQREKRKSDDTFLLFNMPLQKSFKDNSGKSNSSNSNNNNQVETSIPVMIEEESKTLEIFTQSYLTIPTEYYGIPAKSEVPPLNKIKAALELNVPSLTENVLDIIRGNLHSALVAMEDVNWGMGCVVINQKKRFSAYFNPSTGVVKIDSDASRDHDLTPMTFRYKSANEVRFKRKELAIRLKQGITIEAAKILLVTEKLLSQCHSFSVEVLKNIEETFVNGQDTDNNNEESKKDDVIAGEKIYRGNLVKAKIQKLLEDEKAERIVTLWRQVIDRSIYPKTFDVKFLIGALYQSNKVDEKWSPSWKPEDVYHEEMLVVRRSDKSLRFCCAEVISPQQTVHGKLQINVGVKEIVKEIDGKKTIVKEYGINNFSQSELQLKIQRRW